MNVLQVLGRSGHTQIEWEPDDEAATEAARREFEALKAAGFLLFVVTEATEFPADAGKVTAQLASAPDVEPAKTPEPVEGVKLSRGRTGKQTRSFQPKAKRTVAVAPMRGGSGERDWEAEPFDPATDLTEDDVEKQLRDCLAWARAEAVKWRGADPVKGRGASLMATKIEEALYRLKYPVP